jgi:Ca2+-binding RTX toxin-like protein
MGRGLAIAAAIVCALVGAQTASAGTLARTGSTVVYTEADSDPSANDVDIVQSGPNYYIGDRNEAITDLGSGCTLVVEWLWFCGQTGNASNPPPTAFDIKLGGGNDRLLPNQYGAAFGCCTPPDIPVTVNGGPGNDSITGALANDVLAGGFGSDVIAGSMGTDRVSYAGRTDGVTVALGSTGANAGSANDGAPGARDTVSEFDVEGVIGSEGADNLSGHTPVPFTLDGRGGPDVITGGDAASVLLGGDGNDNITGGAGDETLEGGDHDDVLDGGFGGDAIDGQAGSDMATYASRSEGVTVDLGNGGTDDGSASDGAPGARDSIQGVEGVIGGSGGDFIDGSTIGLALTLEGRGGGDRIRGGLGPNTLRGGDGNDNLEGRGGVDLLEGGDGHDSMDGLGGADVLRGGLGFDSVNARDGIADDVDCGPDDDVATTDAIDTRVNCDPAPAPASGSGGGESTTTNTTTTVTVFGPARLVFDLGYVYSATRRATTLSEVSLEVEPGARLKATCRTPKGKRCERTRDVTKAAGSGTVRLRGFERKPLPVGAMLQIRATKPNMVGAVKTVTIRKRKAPSVKTLCLPPGATRPAAC